MTPTTWNELAYLAAGVAIARGWNVAKRLWLYRGEATPPTFRYDKFTAWLADAPAYLWSWLSLSFMWFDPYLGEPSKHAITRWL